MSASTSDSDSSSTSDTEHAEVFMGNLLMIVAVLLGIFVLHVVLASAVEAYWLAKVRAILVVCPTIAVSRLTLLLEFSLRTGTSFGDLPVESRIWHPFAFSWGRNDPCCSSRSLHQDGAKSWTGIKKIPSGSIAISMSALTTTTIVDLLRAHLVRKEQRRRS